MSDWVRCGFVFIFSILMATSMIAPAVGYHLDGPDHYL